MKKFLLSLMAILAFVGVQAQVEITWSKHTDWTLDAGAGTATITSGDYTISAAKAEGGSVPTVIEASVDFRAYAKNTVTISADGKEFTKLVFTLSEQGTKRMGEMAVNEGTLTYNDEYTVLTWEGDPTSEIIITVGEKSGDYASQANKAQQFCFISPVAITEVVPPVMIETDLTKDFKALTVNTNWTTGAGKAAGYTATEFCPMVEVNGLGQKQVCEFYEADCNRTGDLLYQTVTDLTPGKYKIELYGGAAFTFGRGFGSQAFTGETGTGDAWGTHTSDTYTAGQHIDTETGVTLYAETSEGTYELEIPIYYATNFPDGAATVTLNNVIIGSNGQVKLGLKKTSASTNWHVIQLKGVTALVKAADVLAAAVAKAEAIAEADVPAALYTEIQNVLTENNKDYEDAAGYEAAIAAIDAVVAKATPYAPLAAVLAQGEAVKANVPAENEAIATYDAAIADVKAAYDAVSVTDFNAAVATIKAALLPLAKAQTANNSDMTIVVENATWTCDQGNGPNPYSTGTETYVDHLPGGVAGKVMYQRIEGLPMGNYEVSFYATANSCWIGSASGDGISQVFANEATLDIPVIAQTGCTPTDYLRTLTAIVGEDGVLEYGIQNVADGGNWFVAQVKSLTLVKAFADLNDLYYEKALPTIEDGQTYRVFTEVGENKFYLKADGYLTANIDDAKVFNFAAVNADGTLYPTGWNLGCKFTNPGLTGGSTGDVIQQGHIIVGGNDRDNWERQVFFLNGDGKYAVRATNANSVNWGAATFWTVTNTDAELPNADYQLTASYVWQLEAVVDDAALTSIVSKLEALIAATDTYTDESNAAAAATTVLEEVKGATYASNKAVREAVANVQATAQTFIAAIAPVQDIDITDFYITNATPTTNADGWTIVLGTAVNQWAGNTYDAANNNAEFWNYGGSTIKQAVTLPAGDFKLNAVAMTRTGMVGTLFAGENTMEIATIGSDVVNNRTQANAWFNEGNGVNELPFTMDAAGNIEIGITTDNATPDHWTVWRSFQLILAAPVTELAQEINIERYTGKGYDATTFEPDFTEGLAFLGIENVTDATLTFINPDDTEVVPTFGGGTLDGWCDETGALVGWGDNSKICVKFNIADADYMVCDMNGADVAGTTYTVKYALSANGKKVIYTINVTFVEKVVTIPTEISDLIVETGVEYTDEENADGNWNEKTAVLTDEQVQSILTELGITSLDEADVLGYNPTTSEFIINFEGYDGWRNAEGDFESYGDNAPFCVKYTDGVTYLCYDKPATSGYNEFAAYWAISNGTKAVLVKITFTTCTAINGVEADTNKAEVIFDLAGRRINKAQKGIYIINGKKVAVK